MLGQLIAEGNTAEVYEWGEKEVLKLFRKEFPKEGIEKEYQVSQMIEKLGLPIPKTGQLIEHSGRYGIIYERINGVSLLDKIMKNPLLVVKYSKQLANIHYKMHQTKVHGLFKYKDALEWNIRRTELTDIQKSAVLQLLEQLPEGETLCHADFHPGNIIVNNNRICILDWMTAVKGQPAADVARTLFLLKDSALPQGITGFAKIMLRLFRSRMAKVYLKQYTRLSGINREDIVKWRIPIEAARLTEWIPESEKDFLLSEINKAISN